MRAPEAEAAGRALDTVSRILEHVLADGKLKNYMVRLEPDELEKLQQRLPPLQIYKMG